MSCKFCGKVFNRSFNLRRHERENCTLKDRRSQEMDFEYNFSTNSIRPRLSDYSSLHLRSPEIRKNNMNKCYTDKVNQQYSIYLVQCKYTLHHLFQLFILATFITYLNTDTISTSIEQPRWSTHNIPHCLLFVD